MLVLIGEGGSGKTTILEELEKRGFRKADNYTTRDKRKKENDEYKFITKEEFEKLWKENKLLQRAEFNREYYGISADSAKKNTACILITDVLKELKEKHIPMTSYYISVPKEIRIERMINRGDSKEEIEVRINNDKDKFKDAREIADYTIENIDLQQAVDKIITTYVGVAHWATRKEKNMIPQKLTPGDEIRIIAPARSMKLLSQEGIESAKQRIEKLGFKVTFGKNVNEVDEVISSPIEKRIEDLHEAFRDKNVKAILTVIGGFNSNQLLKYIDYDLLKNNPKIFSRIFGHYSIIKCHLCKNRTNNLFWSALFKFWNEKGI
jgi:guanylate kinase